MTAIAGTYGNVKFLTTIGVARITIDVDMADWSNHRDVLGDPPSQDGAKKYVALTRITEDAFKKWAAPLVAEEKPKALTRLEYEPEVGEAPSGAKAVEPEKPHPRFKEMYRSQQAAIKCSDVAFQWWLCNDVRPQTGRVWPRDDMSANSKADMILKEHLGISSKRELDEPGPKAEAFDRLIASYQFRDQVRS